METLRPSDGSISWKLPAALSALLVAACFVVLVYALTVSLRHAEGERDLYRNGALCADAATALYQVTMGDAIDTKLYLDRVIFGVLLIDPSDRSTPELEASFAEALQRGEDVSFRLLEARTARLDAVQQCADLTK